MRNNWVRGFLLGLIIGAFLGMSLAPIAILVAQGSTYSEIPESTKIFDLPPDVCYSVVDQTPYIIDNGYSGGGTYSLSYISISGDSVFLAYSWDAMNAHYWLNSKYVAKASIQPKCFQLPVAIKAK